MPLISHSLLSKHSQCLSNDALPPALHSLVPFRDECDEMVIFLWDDPPEEQRWGGKLGNHFLKETSEFCLVRAADVNKEDGAALSW